MAMYFITFQDKNTKGHSSYLVEGTNIVVAIEEAIDKHGSDDLEVVLAEKLVYCKDKNEEENIVE